MGTAWSRRWRARPWRTPVPRKPPRPRRRAAAYRHGMRKLAFQPPPEGRAFGQLVCDGYTGAPTATGAARMSKAPRGIPRRGSSLGRHRTQTRVRRSRSPLVQQLQDQVVDAQRHGDVIPRAADAVAAAAVRRGMSWSSACPGPRKNGQTMTVVAPRFTHRARTPSRSTARPAPCGPARRCRTSRRSARRSSAATCSSIRLLSSRREPWSTMMMPVLHVGEPTAKNSRVMPRSPSGRGPGEGFEHTSGSRVLTPPHPNPLPEGEGTKKDYRFGSASVASTLDGLPVAHQLRA